jgi:hypothetical protein
MQNGNLMIILCGGILMIAGVLLEFFYNPERKKLEKEYINLFKKEANAPFVDAKNNQEYMIGYAQRTVLTKNQDIKATDETSFVEDLIKYYHIEIIENNLN